VPKHYWRLADNAIDLGFSIYAAAMAMGLRSKDSKLPSSPKRKSECW
jgi:hypothetical protein